MYCHIHHCHYHHCNCEPKDNKEKGGALTQDELLALTQEMKDELKDYTVYLKDQIFSYIDVGLNPVEINNSINSLKEQDTYILRTLTNKIDELNNSSNLSMFNLRTKFTELENNLSSKTTYKYDSVLDMIADIKLKVGQFVETLGYTQPGDGGENKYIIESVGTQEVDGGSFIKLSNGLIAKALFPGNIVRPQHFGANENKDSTAEMFYLNKYVNSLKGCTIEFVTDITAQPISWVDKSDDPNINWGLFKAPHILRVPANTEIRMLNGSILKVGKLPYRFNYRIIHCTNETKNSVLNNCRLHGAYVDSLDIPGRKYQSIISDTLSGKLTTGTGLMTSLTVIIPKDILKPGTSVKMVDKELLTYYDLTGSNEHLSWVQLDDIYRDRSSITDKGDSIEIFPGFDIKGYNLELTLSSGEVKKIPVTVYCRGEHGAGLEFSSSEDVIVNNAYITNTAGDGISIGPASYTPDLLNVKNLEINNLNIHYCRRQGISINSLVDSKFNNVKISNIRGTEPSAGIDIETDNGLDASVRNITFDGLDIRNVDGDGFIHYNMSHSGEDSYLIKLLKGLKQDITLKNVYIENAGKSGISLWRIPFPNKFTIENATIVNSNHNGITIVAPGTKENVYKHIKLKDIFIDGISADGLDDPKNRAAILVMANIYWYSNATEKGYVIGGLDIENLVTLNNTRKYPTNGGYGIVHSLWNSNIPYSDSGVLMTRGDSSKLTNSPFINIDNSFSDSIIYLTANNFSTQYLVTKGTINRLILLMRDREHLVTTITNARDSNLLLDIQKSKESSPLILVPNNLTNKIIIPAYSTITLLTKVYEDVEYVVVISNTVEIPQD